MTIIADPLFYLLAVPAVVALGLSKGGFAGVGQMATPMLAVATNLLGFWLVRITPQATFYRITMILMFLISLELVRAGMTEILRG